MIQLRNYITIEQSKKLAEILPIESADMTYAALVEGMRGKINIKGWEVKVGLDATIKEKFFSYINGYMFPCWSLAALLNIINKDFYPNIFHDGEAWNIEVVHHDNNAIKYDMHSDDIIDVVFEMIVYLHELNLL